MIKRDRIKWIGQGRYTVFLIAYGGIMKKLICLSFTIILIITCSSCFANIETTTIETNQISSSEKSFPFTKPDFKDSESVL